MHSTGGHRGFSGSGEFLDDYLFELLSIVQVGCIASRVCRVRYESMYGKATLNERYQVRIE